MKNRAKNRATIHMGASCWEVIVNDGHGRPVHFDLYNMEHNKRKQFLREFMKAYRAAA